MKRVLKSTSELWGRTYCETVRSLTPEDFESEFRCSPQELEDKFSVHIECGYVFKLKQKVLDHFFLRLRVDLVDREGSNRRWKGFQKRGEFSPFANEWEAKPAPVYVMMREVISYKGIGLKNTAKRKSKYEAAVKSLRKKWDEGKEAEVESVLQELMDSLENLVKGYNEKFTDLLKGVVVDLGVDQDWLKKKQGIEGDLLEERITSTGKAIDVLKSERTVLQIELSDLHRRLLIKSLGADDKISPSAKETMAEWQKEADGKLPKNLRRFTI